MKREMANVRRVGVGAYEIVEGEGVFEEKRAEVPKTSKGPGVGIFALLLDDLLPLVALGFPKTVKSFQWCSRLDLNS